MNLSQNNIEIARNLLKRDCSYCKYINIDSYDYKDVIKLWLKFKKNKSSRIQYKRVIYEIFDFHLTNNKDHAILYQSKNLKNALVMYKIKGNYVNLLLPNYYNKYSQEYSFLATYI